MLIVCRFFMGRYSAEEPLCGAGLRLAYSKTIVAFAYQAVDPFRFDWLAFIWLIRVS